MLENLKYPIGKFEETPFSEKKLAEWLMDIKFLPLQIESAILNLDEAQLHTAYRPDGWTVHDLIHHVADSHMQAYTRFKLGLTEENPTIKPYDEAAWATLADTKNLPVNISFTLLHAVHLRWHEVLKNIKAEEWNRTVFHPGQKKVISLWNLLGQYSWHGRHHVAHILNLRKRMDW